MWKLLSKPQPTQEQIQKYAKYRLPNDISIGHLEAKKQKFKILLMGKTGAGKSAFGNLLLGRKEFKSEPGLTSITGKSACAEKDCGGVYQVYVVDTPGLSDASEVMDDEEALKEIAKGLLLTVTDGDPGVDVVLFCISTAERFSRDQQHVLQYFQAMNSTVTNFWSYVIPIFTHINEIGISNDTEQRQFILDSAKDPRGPIGLKWLLYNVQNRFMVVDSACSSPEYQSAKRAELLWHLGKVTGINDGRRYTNEMLLNAFKFSNPDLTTNIQTRTNTADNTLKSGIDMDPESAIVRDIKVRAQELQELEQCFPGESTVITKDGVKFMHELKPGDKVLSISSHGSTIFSEVITFLHYEPKTIATYMAIQTKSGALLHVSGNHLVFSVTQDKAKLKFKAVIASCLQPGDYILGINSPSYQVQSTQVANITAVRKEGVYAPMTQCGTIVVDSSVASCYASYPSHTVAHVVMAPLRIYYTITKQHHHEKPIKEGVNSYASLLYKLVY